jgi:hypothetical protein
MPFDSWAAANSRADRNSRAHAHAFMVVVTATEHMRLTAPRADRLFLFPIDYMIRRL